MVDVTLVCLAALFAASFPDDPTPGDEAWLAGGTWFEAADQPDAGPTFRPAADWDELVIRAQSFDSPYYEELPAPGGGYGLPQYPHAPSYPSPGPLLPEAPHFGAPAAPGGFGAPVGPTPYDPFLGQPAPGMAAPGMWHYGVNGPQPFRFGPAPRLDVGYIAPADATGGYGRVDVFELDFAMPWATPVGPGDVFTFTPEFDLRLFDGPSSPPGRPGFPNDLYRFGTDFAYSWSDPFSRWSGEVGFNPSINTDFERRLTIRSINWDGRAIAFFQASPTLTVALGALYWDRVTDRLLPYGGVIWLPNDRWEFRFIFPEPRISYFAGHVWGRPMWVYLRGEYNIESWEVEVPPGRRNELQMEDWRLLIGARKEQTWGQTFVEGGWVFNRRVRYANSSIAPGFDIGDAFIIRAGMRF